MRLAFTDVGSGPAVVLIHGLGGSREIFTELMAALGSGVRCVAIDLPDMGESGAWASQSPGEIAVALQTFLRSRGIERAVVVGHSYGGLTAMEFAARFPSAVRPCSSLPRQRWACRPACARSCLGWCRR